MWESPSLVYLESFVPFHLPSRVLALVGTNEAKSRALGARKGSGIFQLRCSLLFLADMDAEREALQSTAFPEVQTFCQKHGLMFEVIASSLPRCPPLPK